MTQEGYFQTATFKMLSEIPVVYRQRYKKSKVFKYACVVINGYNTVVVYKSGTPIAICSSLVSAALPLVLDNRYARRCIHQCDLMLADTTLFLDTPRYVYPAQ